MTEQKRPGPLENLDARLRDARAQSDRGKGDSEKDTKSGLSFAFRTGLELVSALIVGVGIGILLDRWLGTAPWLMIVFFVLGAAAGFMNVYRVMRGLDQAVGYRRDGPGQSRSKDRADNQ